MSAVEFGAYLKSLRKKKKLTIRQLDTYSGVSNSYISQMERGERGVPSPDILKKLYRPLGVEYEELMTEAGYIQADTKKEHVIVLPESEYERMIIEIEQEFNLNLRNDPIVLEASRELIRRMAQMKQSGRQI